MEGCPKAVMINFDLKEISSMEEDAFQKPLSQYIQDFYHEDPKSYATELQQITQLRKNLIHIPRDKQGCDVLRKYYAQLHYLQSRFPMASGGVACVPFIWHDVYSGEPAVYNDVRYEQACLLFNLGGLYSQLGTNESRLTEESMKIACTYFQSAAGVFSFLKENFALSEMPDMTDEIITLKITVMLGQALECILEKSILDDKNQVLIAGICVQIRDYFNEAINLLDHSGTSEMGSYLRKSWTKHLKIKVLSYEALAYTYFSNDKFKKDKYGEQVGYLTHANEKINEASKLLKNQSQKVNEMVTFIMDVVGNKYNSAVKDNDFIYHMAIPDVTALEEIKAVNFVKPLPFKYDDQTISGPDIFKKLVPMRAHESSSLYSELKADLLRKVTASMQEKDMQLSEYMAALKIEDLIDPKEDSLPEEILAKNKFLQDNPDIISKVEKNLGALVMITSGLDNVYGEMKMKLQNEKLEEEHDDGEMSPELKLLLEELGNCEDAHTKASKTNQELGKHFNDSKSLIHFLSGSPESILKSLPSKDAVDVPSDEPIVQRIREILGKVDKMKNQRLKFLSQLREELNKDDITAQLAVRDKGNNEGFFEEQLKKHDKIVVLIKQNLSAQEAIMQALTEANAKYAVMREKTSDICAQFDLKVRSYIGVITLFLDLKDKIRSGLEFYEQLKKNVTILETKVNAYCQKKEKNRPLKKTSAVCSAPPSRPTAPKPNIMKANALPANQVPYNMRMEVEPGYQLDQQRNGGYLPQSFNHGPQRFSHQQYPATGPPKGGAHLGITRQKNQHSIADATLKVSPFGLANSHADRININADGRSTDIVHQGVQVGPRFPSQPRVDINVPIQPHTDNSFVQGRQSFRPNMQAQNTPGFSENRFSTPRYPSQGMRIPFNIKTQDNMERYPEALPPTIQPPNQQPLKSLTFISQHNTMHPQQRPPIHQYQHQIQGQHIPPASLQQSHGQPGPHQVQPHPHPVQLRPTTHQMEQTRIHHVPSHPQQQPQSQSLHQGQVNIHPLSSQQQPAVLSQFSIPPNPSQSRAPPSSIVQQSQTYVNYPSQDSSQRQLHSRLPSQTSNLQPSISQSRFSSKPSNVQPVHTQVSIQPAQQPNLVSQFHFHGNNPPHTSLQSNQNQPPLQAHHQPQSANQVPMSQFPPQSKHEQNFSQTQFQSQSIVNNQQQHQPVNRQQKYDPQISTQQNAQYISHQVQSQFKPHLPLTSAMEMQRDMLPRPQQNKMHFQQTHGSNIAAPYSHVHQTVNVKHGIFREAMPMNAPLSDNNALPLPLLPEKALEGSNQNNYQQLDQNPTLMYPRTTINGAGVHQQVQNQVINIQDGCEKTGNLQSAHLISNAISQSHRMLQQDSSQQIYTCERIQGSQLLNEKNQSFPNQIHHPSATGTLATQINQMSMEMKPNTDVNINVGLPSAPPMQIQRSNLPNQSIDDHYIRSRESQRVDYQNRVASAIPYSGPSINQANVSSHAGLSFATKPMMSLDHDPVVSNILGKGMSRNVDFGEIAQFNFAQIHLQNMVLQQQQLISILQTQQQHNQRNEEDSKIKELQQKIDEQQKLIDEIKNRQQKDEVGNERAKEGLLDVECGKEEMVKSDKDNKDCLKADEKGSKLPEEFSKVGKAVNCDETVRRESVPSFFSENVTLPSVQNSTADTVIGITEAIDYTDHASSNMTSSASNDEAAFKPTTEDAVLLDTEDLFNSNPKLVSDGTNSNLLNAILNKPAQFYEPKVDCKVSSNDSCDVILPKDSHENKVSTSDEAHSVANLNSNEDEEVILPRSDEQVVPSEDSKTVLDNLDASGTVKTCANLNEKVDIPETSTKCKDSLLQTDSPLSDTNSQIINESCDSPAASCDSPAASTKSSNNDIASSTSCKMNGQVVQLDDMHKADRRASDLIDHRYFARQLGRTSFYVGGPEGTIWLKYIQELDAAVLKLHTLCKSLCKPVDSSEADGFVKIWNDLGNLEEMDVKHFSTLNGSANISKNRYSDILPWDHTRIKITTLENDYINANFIQNLTPLSPLYIATQGPIPQTFQDFWTMVWEQKARIIIMLTNEIEGTKLKCHRYWSRESDSRMEFENLAVIFMDETESSGWRIRNFTLVDKMSDDTMTVTQLQFTSWPDYGTPESPYELLAFMEDVFHHHESYDPSFESPIILHCSAGVGRTGSFCCIYSAIREMRGQHGLIEIPGVIRKLRQYRPHMVQRKEQLIFCYQAVLCFAQNFTSTEMINISCGNNSRLSANHEEERNSKRICENQSKIDEGIESDDKKRETNLDCKKNTFDFEVVPQSNQVAAHDPHTDGKQKSEDSLDDASISSKTNAGGLDSAKAATE